MQSPHTDTDCSAAPEPEPSDPSVPQLQNALAAANNRIASLEKTYQDQIRVQHAYEESLAEATDRIRNYCFEQQNYITSMHQYYVKLIQQSRQETMDAQLTHQAWQAGLQRVSEGVRESLKAREEEGAPWRKRIAALKSENRLLRKKVGWEPPVESESESEEEDGKEEEKMRERLRPVQGIEERRALNAEREAIVQGLRESQEKLRRETGQQGQVQGQGQGQVAPG